MGSVVNVNFSIEAANVLLMKENFSMNDSVISMAFVMESFLSFLLTNLELFFALVVILFSF